MVKCLNIRKNIGKPIYRPISKVYIHDATVFPSSVEETYRDTKQGNVWRYTRINTDGAGINNLLNGPKKEKIIEMIYGRIEQKHVQVMHPDRAFYSLLKFVLQCFFL